ncbi:Putative flippase GtrA (transmembrane translocase of bactoprenol-linked glucose) [Marinococcus luteus]|jgi:putative flippase GtrA|uniref:Putative flippase GtrA (Transmembrane translocase of bactoprenol-linked glucose) n=1 Tax=Marinococcus luteus TaxID=1122204 RepID=A0A1H2UJ57_9BACI|nr:GtrA family protein [Marinococcus luteus]SDW56196.1 Putative flippase GtrA (transmembrane translocase of bactoprenol-linked glucose) [Marinococcus luteus]
MKQLDNEFTRFVLVGGMNTLNYYAAYLLLHVVLSVPYMIAHITGFFISFVISFFLNTYFTYKVRPTWKKFFQFPLTQVVNVGTSSVFAYIFVEWLGINSTIAPLGAVIFTIPVTFIVTGKILKR